MPDLRARPPGYEVAREFLRLQEARPPRSRLARIFGFDPIHEDAVGFLKGTLGEIEVGRILKRLGPEWTVIHAVPAGAKGRDIDHLLVGPAGVFTLNTKRHKGKKVWVGGRAIQVNGQKTDHVRNSNSEVAHAAKVLSAAVGGPVVVRALLVIVGAESVTTKARAEGVTVLQSSQLLFWLKKQKPIHDPDAAAQLARIAADSRTWQATDDYDGTVMDRFAVLRAEDDAAIWVRRTWGAGLLVGCLALILAAGPLISAALTGFFALMTP